MASLSVDIKPQIKIWGFILFFALGLSGCGDLDTELSSITISPSSATIGINKTQLFTVTAKDSLGFIVDVTPTWSVTGGIGTISSTGLFTAGVSSGEGHVVASYEGISDLASVTVTEKGWLTGVIRNPELGYAQGIIVYLAEISSLRDDTDSNGKYLIANIPAGTYEARTEETQLYQVASEEVTIGKGETVTWTTTLIYKPGIPTIPTTTFFSP